MENEFKLRTDLQTHLQLLYNNKDKVGPLDIVLDIYLYLCRCRSK